MKLKSLLSVLLIAFSLLLIMMLSLLHVQQISHAQSPPITLSNTLNRSSNVVRVGEVLSFNILLENTSGFTLTNVTLVDNYDASILRFAGAVPSPDIVTSGVLTWSNVATPPLAAGQSLTFTVFFTAEHPQTAVVNAVRAQDIISGGSSLTQTAEASQTHEAIGGAAPVVKSLHPPGSVPQAGLPITFTHLITNDGAAIMTRLPLTDTYNPTFLQFHFAVPTPTIISPGLLVWTDLTTYFGNIPPFGSVVVTTVFTATTQVINTENSASTEGAIDEYSNDLTAGSDQVPITIVDVPSAPAPAPTSDDSDDNDDTPTPAPTATPLPAFTPTPMATQAVTDTMQGPLYLPETGWRPVNRFIVPLWGLVLLTLGWYIARRSDNR